MFPPVYIRYDPLGPQCIGGFLLRNGSPELFRSKVHVAERLARLRHDWPNGKLFELWHFEVVAAETTKEVVRITEAELRPKP